MFDPHQEPLDIHAGAGDAQTSTRALHLPAEGDLVRDMLARLGIDVDGLVRERFIDPVELDTGFPLQDYYISSSHNTYLPEGQLYGSSSAEEYVSVISRSARCVEVDAWPDKDQGPPHCKVTHGFTLTSRLPLPTVIDAVLRGLDQGSSKLPLVVSLENHTEDDGFQAGLVKNFTEIMGIKLVQGEIDGVGRKPLLEHFMDRIILMVEYYPPTASIASSATPKQTVPAPADDESDDSSDDEAAVQLRKDKKAGRGKISPALAHLGFYAASIKPGKGHGWVGQERQEVPPNPLINISESALLGLLDPKTDKKGEIREGVIHRTREGLMRVYPKGLRVFSKNPDPRPFWAVGAQVVALNFQTFDAHLQLNEALFSGTGGWLLKPPHLRSDAGPGDVKGTLKHLKVNVTLGGISGLKGLFESGQKERRPYCKMYLHHSKGIHKSRSASLSSVTPSSDSAVWDESFGDVVVEDDGLIFVRLVFKNNERLATDAHLGVFTAYLPHVARKNEWGLVRLLAPSGKETDAVLALKIDVAETSSTS